MSIMRTIVRNVPNAIIYEEILSDNSAIYSMPWAWPWAWRSRRCRSRA